MGFVIGDFGRLDSDAPFFKLGRSGTQSCVTAALNRGPLLKDRMADPGPGLPTGDTNQHNQ